MGVEKSIQDIVVAPPAPLFSQNGDSWQVGPLLAFFLDGFSNLSNTGIIPFLMELYAMQTQHVAHAGTLDVLTQLKGFFTRQVPIFSCM